MGIYPSEKEFWKSFTRYNALSSPKYHWHTSSTEQDIRCTFGCVIPGEEVFFKKPMDAFCERAVSVCWECMERMVYLTVDIDLHARTITTRLKQHAHLHESTDPLLT